MKHKKHLLLLLLAVFLPSGCMGGGSGGSSSAGPTEIAYVLSEDTNHNNNGYVVEYGLSPSTGNFQVSASPPLSTGGSTPFQILLSPHNHWAFVLNNNNSSDTTPSAGSVASFSVSSNGLSQTSGSPQAIGENTVNMAIDPGGTYLVVANHGNGTSTGTGSVGVMSYNANGQLSSMNNAGSPCAYPFRVVFQPGAAGSTGDMVDVVCSSPELLGTTSPPTLVIYACSIVQLETINGCGSGSSITLPSGTTTNTAMLNFVFDPSTNYAVGPAVTNAEDGFLIVCTLASTLTCNTPYSFSDIISSSPNTWLPSGNISFFNSGGTPTVYIGNYYPNSNSTFYDGNLFAPCSISSSATTCSSTPFTSNSSQEGPIYLATQGSHLYIISTVTPIAGSFNGSSQTTNPSIPTSNEGFLFSCPLPISTTATCSTPVTTGYWPVGISSDPNANYLFVPTLSQAINVYAGASIGNLSPFQTLSDPYTPISVIIH